MREGRFNTRTSQQLVLHQMVLHTARYRVTELLRMGASSSCGLIRADARTRLPLLGLVRSTSLQSGTNRRRSNRTLTGEQVQTPLFLPGETSRNRCVR